MFLVVFLEICLDVLMLLTVTEVLLSFVVGCSMLLKYVPCGPGCFSCFSVFK